MEIKINIEKKYAWLLLITLFAVGFVVAYGGNNPQVMGHSFGEIEGVAPNCNHNNGTPSPPCAILAAQTQWDPKDVASWAAESWNSNKLQGKQASDFAVADYYTMDVDVLYPYASACTGSAKPSDKCCDSSMTEYCKQKGYKFGVVTGTCGKGWCQGPWGSCPHSGYCVK